MNKFWIKVSVGIRDHPKTDILSASLDCSLAAAIGHLVCLWAWAVEHIDRDGCLGTIPARMIARQVAWEGDPDQFETALADAGFLDPATRCLHDWQDYTEEFYKGRDKAESDRKRARRNRKARANNPRTVREPSANRPRTVREPSRPLDRDLEREERETSLKARQDRRAPAHEADQPQSQTEFETALRSAPTHEERDQVVLQAFHWQHGVLPLKKKRQGLLGYCRSYGHAHVLATVFAAAETFPDHPEAYVLKMLATPPARDAGQADRNRRSDQALAELGRLEREG